MEHRLTRGVAETLTRTAKGPLIRARACVKHLLVTTPHLSRTINGVIYPCEDITPFFVRDECGVVTGRCFTHSQARIKGAPCRRRSRGRRPHSSSCSRRSRQLTHSLTTHTLQLQLRWLTSECGRRSCLRCRRRFRLRRCQITSSAFLPPLL